MSQTRPVHDHDHDHRHTQPTDNKDYETANKHHFDAAAHRYDNDLGAHKLAEKIGRAMINTWLFKPGITTIMDFACGTGLISRVLAATDPKSIVGIDISQAMVDQYNKIVYDHGIPPEEMRAVCATLGGDDSQALGGMTFDVIVCASAYHHIASIDEVTRTLVSFLNPGGSLLVADLCRSDSEHEIFPEKAHHIVVHKGGFMEEDIRSTFDKAGLKNFTFDIIAHVKHSGHPTDIFLARGDK